MKQLLTSVQLYADDNNEVVPAHFTFDGANEAAMFRKTLAPYLKFDHSDYLFLCPSDDAAWKKIAEPGSGREPISGAMSHTHCLSLKAIIPDFASDKRLLKISSVGDPATVKFMRDPIWVDGDQAKSYHGDGIVIGSLDTHAKYKKPVDIKADL